MYESHDRLLIMDSPPAYLSSVFSSWTLLNWRWRLVLFSWAKSFLTKKYLCMEWKECYWRHGRLNLNLRWLSLLGMCFCVNSANRKLKRRFWAPTLGHQRLYYGASAMATRPVLAGDWLGPVPHLGSSPWPPLGVLQRTDYPFYWQCYRDCLGNWWPDWQENLVCAFHPHQGAAEYPSTYSFYLHPAMDQFRANSYHV